MFKFPVRPLRPSTQFARAQIRPGERAPSSDCGEFVGPIQILTDFRGNLRNARIEMAIFRILNGRRSSSAGINA